MQTNQATNQPNQVQLSPNHNSSISTNLLISASSSFSSLNRQSSPLSNFNSSILHPIVSLHPNSHHLVHPNQLTSSINSHNLPLPQSVLQSAQLLRNNYDSLLYVNGQLPSSNLPNSINFNAINQLNQLSHHLNQIPLAAAAASLHSLQQQQQQQQQNNDNQSDNLSVCSNLSGSLKSEDTTLNSSSCGFNTSFKLSNSLKNSNNLLGTSNGQLRCTPNTPNSSTVNELKFSVNSILNASNYSSNQLRNDGKFCSVLFSFFFI